MRPYDLTPEAESDLRGILLYTLKQWGREQVKRYGDLLADKLESIARGEVALRRFSENLPTVLVTKCAHHFIFYTLQGRDKPLVLAILHEKQDILARIAHRLDGE